jgi:hypothetical protein
MGHSRLPYPPIMVMPRVLQSTPKDDIVRYNQDYHHPFKKAFEAGNNTYIC